MSTKAELSDQLTALGVEFDPTAKKETLEALLASNQAPHDPAIPEASAAPAPSTSHSEVEVGDPLVLRPVDLPLVVKPANGGSWKNEDQAKFARVLNAFAYSQPKKWAERKDYLIAQLIEIGTNPELRARLAGEIPGQPTVQYNDTRIGQGQ